MTSAMSSRAEKTLKKVCQRLYADPGLPKANPTQSYWQLPAAVGVATLQSSEWHDSTDVVIIGSGISGCSITRHLLQGDDSLRVTVLEARNITSGATGRNGGHIKSVPEYEYPELLPLLGKEGADDVVRFTLANVDELLKVSSTLSPELQGKGEARRVESLNIFAYEDELNEFAESVKKFSDVYPFQGYFVSKEDLKQKYDIHNAAGAYMAPAGAGWPYRLITGMFADMLDRYQERFKIEANTPVQSIEYSENETRPYRVHTSRGAIRARHVIHATNGYSGHLLPAIRGALFPIRGQMTAQAPTKRFGVQGATRSWSVHYGHGFDYMIQSGQSGEIFIGGGLGQAGSRGLDEMGNTNDDQLSVLAKAHLEGIINSIWPAKADEPSSSHVLAAWTGVMGFTADGFPLVGRLPQEATSRSGHGEWISAGFNGYGMANAWLCGKYVADKMLGRDDDGLLPRPYKISAERLKLMEPTDTAKRWMKVLGVD